MDSQPDSRPENAGSLLTTGRYPTLNTVAVARLRAFLDALKAEGIWANLNLKVGYVFRPSVDGVPALAGGAAMPTQSKPLHMMLPRMIELQADYTRAVIDALALDDDPVLAMVEINNESSLVQAWQSNQMDASVTGEYEAEFRRQWNGWLAARYPDTATLSAAWGGGEPDGPELLRTGRLAYGDPRARSGFDGAWRNGQGNRHPGRGLGLPEAGRLQRDHGPPLPRARSRCAPISPTAKSAASTGTSSRTSSPWRDGHQPHHRSHQPVAALHVLLPAHLCHAGRGTLRRGRGRNCRHLLHPQLELQADVAPGAGRGGKLDSGQRRAGQLERDRHRSAHERLSAVPGRARPPLPRRDPGGRARDAPDPWCRWPARRWASAAC